MTTEGSILRLTDVYQPNFYVFPKDQNHGTTFFQTLSQESTVSKVEWEHKLIELFDVENREILLDAAETVLGYFGLIGQSMGTR